MSQELEPVENHLRSGEPLDLSAELVIRGWPLTVDGLLRNADATRRRYSFNSEPFIAISAEIAVPGWSVQQILAGPRLRTRRSYAVVSAEVLIDAGFALLPTFAAPHYSIDLVSYTEQQAGRLAEALGEAETNPHFTRRSS